MRDGRRKLLIGLGMFLLGTVALGAPPSVGVAISNQPRKGLVPLLRAQCWVELDRALDIN